MSPVDDARTLPLASIFRGYQEKKIFLSFV